MPVPVLRVVEPVRLLEEKAEVVRSLGIAGVGGLLVPVLGLLVPVLGLLETPQLS